MPSQSHETTLPRRNRELRMLLPSLWSSQEERQHLFCHKLPKHQQSTGMTRIPINPSRGDLLFNRRFQICYKPQLEHGIFSHQAQSQPSTPDNCNAIWILLLSHTSNGSNASNGHLSVKNGVYFCRYGSWKANPIHQLHHSFKRWNIHSPSQHFGQCVLTSGKGQHAGQCR